jgi:hypothetical protein
MRLRNTKAEASASALQNGSANLFGVRQPELPLFPAEALASAKFRSNQQSCDTLVREGAAIGNPTVRGCRKIEKLGSSRLANNKVKAMAFTLQKGLPTADSR